MIVRRLKDTIMYYMSMFGTRDRLFVRSSSSRLDGDGDGDFAGIYMYCTLKLFGQRNEGRLTASLFPLQGAPLVVPLSRIILCSYFTKYDSLSLLSCLLSRQIDLE